MLSEITNSFSAIFSGIVGWFIAIYDAIPGSYALVLAGVMMLLTVSFLIVPLRGAGISIGSDYAKRKKKERSEDE